MLSTGTPGGKTRGRYCSVLLLEQLPTGEGDDPRRHARAGQRGGRRQAVLHLAPRTHEHDLGHALGVGQDVGPAGHTLGSPAPCGRLGQDGHVLAGQDQADRILGVDGKPPGLRRLVGVGRPDELSPGMARSDGELLDRLVRGTVLAQADRIVGPRVDDVRPGQRGQADRRAHVVGEDEEGAPHGRMPPCWAMPFITAAHGDARGCRSGPACPLGTRPRAPRRPDSLTPLLPGEVGRPGDQARYSGRRGVDAGVDGPAGGHGLPGVECWQGVGPTREPAPRLGGVPRGTVTVPGGEAGFPLPPQLGARGQPGPRRCAHVVGHPEGLVGREAEESPWSPRSPRRRKGCRGPRRSR